MDEKKVIKLSDEIVSNIVDFSLGKGKMKAIIPKSVAKKMASDEDLFESLKQCYIKYLSTVDSKVNESSEVKRLSDFRFQLVDIFTQNVPEEDVNLEE
ncbi:MAG: hypothetical protein K5890_08335 [Bacteroidales bacterium]|nr:hypothetical protein [Bacteroidales bacterium]